VNACCPASLLSAQAVVRTQHAELLIFYNITRSFFTTLLEDVILVLDGCTDPARHLDKLDEDVRLFVRGVIEDFRPGDFREVMGSCLEREAISRVERIEWIFRKYF
jgi:hypothetical protein